MLALQLVLCLQRPSDCRRQTIMLDCPMPLCATMEQCSSVQSALQVWQGADALMHSDGAVQLRAMCTAGASLIEETRHTLRQCLPIVRAHRCARGSSSNQDQTGPCLSWRSTPHDVQD